MKIFSAVVVVPLAIVICSTHAAFIPSSINAIQTTTFKSSSPLYMEKLDSVKDTLANLSKQTKPAPLTPSPPPPFDPTNPEALISITKSFIATDFGIQSSQLPDYSTAQKKTTPTNLSDSFSTSLPYFSSSLLSSSFIWVSGNNIRDGRTGLLTKDEYLAAGRYFNLRNSFPDLEYRAHDFRIIFNESGLSKEVNSNSDGESSSASSPLDAMSSALTPIERLTNNNNDDDLVGDKGEITVRFTTRTTGTFRGGPLKLRSMILEPNGKVMKCPPTSISITYSTRGEDRGKIIKLVTDMVLDRQLGNTNGQNGIPAAAIIAGAKPSPLLDTPPLIALSRVLSRPLKPVDEGASVFAPFPDSVMIQLAKGVLSSNFGLDDENLLAEKFTYIDNIIGPLDKEKYLEVFGEEYYVRDGFSSLDYGLQNFRVDPYDPYRVWVDTKAKGIRTGSIGKRMNSGQAAVYDAAPECISFTFDDDGFCTRFTAGAVMDPLIGNTGGLGSVYGILYATGTPVNPLITRSFNEFVNRASKSLFSNFNGLGADKYKLRDGRIVSGGGNLPSSKNVNISLSRASTASASPVAALPQVAQKKRPQPPASPKPFFAAELTDTPPSSSTQKISETPAGPVTGALNSAFGITAEDEKQGITRTPAPTIKVGGSNNKAQQLRNAAQSARAEAAEAKKRAMNAKLEKEEKQKKEEAVQKKKKEEMLELARKKREEETPLSRMTSSPKNSLLKPPVMKKQTFQKPSARASPAKKSPTINLFDSFKPRSPPAKPKAYVKPKVTVTKGSEAKRSPTISLFGAYSPQKKDKKKAKSIQKSQPKTKASVPVKSRPTISLFGLGGNPISSGTKATPKAKISTQKTTSSPRGVPVISKWTLDPSDMTISGFISGSRSFQDGVPVTTSTIVGDKANSNTLVRTKSGSKYFLGDEDISKDGGIFSLFGGGEKLKKVAVSAAPKVKSAPVFKKSVLVQKVDTLEQAALEKNLNARFQAKRDADEKRRIAAEEAKAKRDAQLQAKKDVDEKRRIAAQAERQRKAEEAKAAAATRREAKIQAKREADEKRRIAAEQAAGKRLRKAEEAKAAAAAAKRDAQLLATNVARAKKTVSQSKPGGTISLFGGGTRPVSKKTVIPAVEKKQPAKKAGGAPAPKKAPVEKKKPAQKSPTFSLLTKAAPPPPAAKKANGRFSGFSFGGGSAPAKKAPINDNVPVLSRFKQNADGSITGTVSNSKNFRSGTTITTSPVAKGAKAGQVVKTSSGSQYRLQ